jgi:hypothetical protein
MKPNRNPAKWLLIFCCSWSSGAGAQTTEMTLRQVIDHALGQNPEAAVAGADEKAATASGRLTRASLFPQLSFTEDISRGDDPVYAFGRLGACHGAAIHAIRHFPCRRQTVLVLKRGARGVPMAIAAD